MRVAILTFHRAYNCGAMLQAWALKTVLERMGHRVEFPICNHVGETPRWRYPPFHSGKSGLAWVRSALGRSLINLLSIPSEDILRSRYRAFRESHLPERMCAPDEFEKYYDLLVVGSDQVWSAWHCGNDAPLFFGETLPQTIRRIAYAASYGDKPLEADELKRLLPSLNGFSAVSVRERLAQAQLAEASGRRIAETLDPTLLLSAGDYDAIASNCRVPKESYLFMYTLYTDEFFIRTARALAGKLGVRCVIAPCDCYSWLATPSGAMRGLSPDRLVQYSRNAKYIVSGSFHGTAMAVIFNKPFLSLRGQVDEYESRPASLLRKLGCDDRLVNPMVSIDEMHRRLVAPHTNFPAEISAAREDSVRWLRGAVEGVVDE